MANYIVTDAQLTGIANAIRAKSGGASPLAFPNGFTSEISGLMTLDDIEAVVDYRTQSTPIHYGTESDPTFIPRGETEQIFIANFDVEEGMLLPKLSANINKFFSTEVTRTNFNTRGNIKFLDPVITRKTVMGRDKILVYIEAKNMTNSPGYIWGDDKGYANISVKLKFLSTILTESSDEEEIPVSDETIIP